MADEEGLVAPAVVPQVVPDPIPLGPGEYEVPLFQMKRGDSPLLLPLKRMIDELAKGRLLLGVALFGEMNVAVTRRSEIRNGILFAVIGVETKK